MTEPVAPSSTADDVVRVRSERRRVTVCAALGVVVAGAAAAWSPWQLALLLGWISTSAVLLVSIAREIARLDAASTARVATQEDDSRAAARAVLVTASLMSLFAVVAALHRASGATFRLEITLIAVALTAVVLSWFVVNSVFLLRYAHLYYGGTRVGGVEFPGERAPAYVDFAYLAFTIGMIFQVSDTAVTDPMIRSTVLRHALLAFVFDVAIIATTINLVAGLL